MEQESIEILFLGDIVGRPGRRIVANFLGQLNGQKPDFIIANIENASHGFGLTEKNYHEMVNLGINALTSGNHIWDKREIFSYIDYADSLVRPLNYPEGTPGVGSRIFNVKGVSIGVISLLGRVFMTPIDSPWTTLRKEVEKIEKETNIIIVDFHAEATAEKQSLGYFADNLGVSAVIGTHTHIQTADEKILKNGAAYITDIGFCGSSHSIIGMEIESSIKKLITGIPDRYEVAPMDMAEVNGVRLSFDKGSGKSIGIERFKYFSELIEVQ